MVRLNINGKRFIRILDVFPVLSTLLQSLFWQLKCNSIVLKRKNQINYWKIRSKICETLSSRYFKFILKVVCSDIIYKHLFAIQALINNCDAIIKVFIIHNLNWNYILQTYQTKLLDWTNERSTILK